MKNWLRVSVLLGLFASAGSAVDWKALKPQGYVSDFAGVIDPASKSQLEAYCATVESSTGAQMALVTIATLEGEPIDDVANTIYRAWGVGQKGKNEGVPAPAGHRRPPQSPRSRLRPRTHPPRRLCRLRAPRDAPRLAPAALRRSPHGRRGNHRRHRRQGEERHPHHAASAPHPRHSHRFHSVARGHRRHRPADLSLPRRRTPRLRWRRGRRLPDRHDPR